MKTVFDIFEELNETKTIGDKKATDFNYIVTADIGLEPAIAIGFKDVKKVRKVYPKLVKNADKYLPDNLKGQKVKNPDVWYVIRSFDGNNYLQNANNDIKEIITNFDNILQTF